MNFLANQNFQPIKPVEVRVIFLSENLNMKITKEYFIEKTGIEPKDDDLERCNCLMAGEFGHNCCGWFFVHEKPIIMCGCIQTVK